MKISSTHTLDGKLVEEGMRVWDYDYRPRIVGKVAYREGGTDPWYEMFDIADGRRGSDMNPSRMYYWHPATGKRP